MSADVRLGLHINVQVLEMVHCELFLLNRQLNVSFAVPSGIETEALHAYKSIFFGRMRA